LYIDRDIIDAADIAAKVAKLNFQCNASGLAHSSNNTFKPLPSA